MSEHKRIIPEFFDPPENNVSISGIDITAIESLSATAIRSGEVDLALVGFALALRLRMDSEIHPQRRHDDP